MTLSRYWNRNLNIVQSLKTEIVTIYMDALDQQRNHGWIIKELNERVYTKPDYIQLPHWVKGQLTGVSDGCQDILYRRFLEWKVRLDDSLLTKERIPNGRLQEVTQLNNGQYYWTGTSVQYTLSQEQYKEMGL